MKSYLGGIPEAGFFKKWLWLGRRIHEIAEKMFLNIDEKSELLMCCKWLEVMKEIEQNITTYKPQNVS